ncbi:hypothetical protein PHMEG_00027347 [Phytophthora megakarya]|uniref:Uncharacterized protein n=1 Tax=Phytophthora megakarya TaxID=4795 RepID=A0A225V7E2_9STRA|nr:hypothetical protein PHMEG_00027347 [Phytophthora megakarya]
MPHISLCLIIVCSQTSVTPQGNTIRGVAPTPEEIAATVAIFRKGTTPSVSIPPTPPSPAPPIAPTTPRQTLTREALCDLVEGVVDKSLLRNLSGLSSQMETLGRLAVGIHLQPAIRGNRRVQELVDAADSVESIYSAAIYPSPAQQPVPTELEGTLRCYVHAAQSAQKVAEGRLLTEIGLRENAEGLLRSCHQEIAALRKSVENAQALTAHYKAVSDKFEANISHHTEVLARSENRVRAAEDTVADLNRQLKHAKSEFMAKIAANTTQVTNLSATLAISHIVDDSAEDKASRRCSELLERNRRLMTANRTLRSRVKLDQLDPDVLVLVTEGSFSIPRSTS